MSEKNVDLVPVGSLPPLGVVPTRMHAWVVRKENHGEPLQSFREEVACANLDARARAERGPRPSYDRAAGVNYNGVWGGLGKPVSVLDVHKHPFHIGGSDCSGIVWKTGSAVKRWKVGDEVVSFTATRPAASASVLQRVRRHARWVASNQKIWGYETPYGSFAQFTLAQSQQLMPKACACA